MRHREIGDKRCRGPNRGIASEEKVAPRQGCGDGSFGELESLGLHGKDVERCVRGAWMREASCYRRRFMSGGGPVDQTISRARVFPGIFPKKPDLSVSWVTPQTSNPRASVGKGHGPRLLTVGAKGKALATLRVLQVTGLAATGRDRFLPTRGPTVTAPWGLSFVRSA